MTRKDKLFLKWALHLGKSSRCHRARYGCLIVSKYNWIIAVSKNDRPFAKDTCYREGLSPGDCGPPCCLHAETIALLKSPPDKLPGSTLYVSGIPCSSCLLQAHYCRISRVVALEDGHNYGGWEFVSGMGLSMTYELVSLKELIDDEEA